MKKIEKIRWTLFGIAIAFVAGSTAMFSFLTTRSISAEDGNGNSIPIPSVPIVCTESASDPSGLYAVRTKISSQDNTLFVTLICPWNGGLMALAYIAIAVSLGFLALILLRFKFSSFKLFITRALLGLLATILLIATLVLLTMSLANSNVPDDFTNNGLDFKFSRLMFRGALVLGLFSLLVIGSLFGCDVVSYRRGILKSRADPLISSAM